MKQTSTIEISLVDWYPWNPLVILNSLTMKINIDVYSCSYKPHVMKNILTIMKNKEERIQHYSIHFFILDIKSYKYLLIILMSFFGITDIT